jgi:putative flippase GtrA
MKNVLQITGTAIRKIIDFFYPPFSRFMSPQFFRYGMSGAANLVFDWSLYFVLYNFVMQHRMLNLGFVTLSPHISAMVLKMPVVLLTGFLLQKYVAFSNSTIRSRIQLFRYSVVFIINLLINYAGLKLLVNYFGFWPTPSNIVISSVTVFISYFSQRRFTFKNG